MLGFCVGNAIFLNSSAKFLIFKVVIAKFVDEYPLLYLMVTFDYHHYYYPDFK